MKLSRWSLALLVALQLGLALASGPASAAKFNCAPLLRVFGLHKAHPDGPLAEPLFATPELFFTDRGVREDSLPFYASNEFDWFKTPWDVSPTDVLVGFGTNSAWDLASRKQAKQLVIGDWVPGPLIVQRFIHRPLLRAAKSPNDYLLMLAGLEAPAEISDSADLSKLQRFISMQMAIMEPREFDAGANRIFLRLKAAGSSEDELRAIAEYHRGLTARPKAGQFGVVRSKHAEELGNLIGFFLQRYLPASLIGQGANRALVSNPEFSFLSSQAAFERFKKLYETSLYAHADYRSREFYEKLKAMGDERGFTKYTFSLTNIFDAAHGDNTADSIRDMDAYREMIYQIFPADKYDVVIFFTTNYRNPHNFYRLERGTPTPAESWVTDLMPSWMRQILTFQTGRAG